MTKKMLALALVVGLLAACTSTAPVEDETPVEEPQVQEEARQGAEAPASDPIRDRLHEAVNGTHRSDANRARDVYRNPLDTLAFFKIEPQYRVVEISPGRGWYTEILGPFLWGEGTLVAGGFAFDPEDEESYMTQIGLAYEELLESQKNVIGVVERGVFAPPETVELGEPGSADMVVTFRNLHGWNNRGIIEDAFAAIFETLKPGGIFGVVQHRAAEGSDPAETSRLGYLPEAFVIELAEQAGFVLDGASEINANPMDTRDHEHGVWSLPPTLRGGEEDAERYREIGESDRMTLRFVKPE